MLPLYIIFALPLTISFYYSYDKDIIWLLSSLLFLLLIPLATFSLTARLKSKWIAFSAALLLLVPVYLFEMTQLVAFYLQGEGFTESFFFHFTFNTVQETWSVYPLLTIGMMLILLIFIVAIYINIVKFKSLPIYLVIIIIGIVPLLDSAVKSFMYNSFLKPVDTYEFNTTQLQKLGLNSNAIMQEKLTATSGKNLVLIYLESLESIYLDETIFPELTPNLKAIATKGLSFSNMYQTSGTSWTIAGIVASQCGTPLLNKNNIINGNDLMQGGFLANATCLSDILNTAGYVQEYLGGASNKFAGKGDFLQDHNYNIINGLDELASKVDNYNIGWGIYDDSLFKIAVKEYTRLANTKQPFNLTLLTLDTHHPEGRPSPSCKAYIHQDDSILHAVHCTDQLVTKFINEISQHPAFKNTIVVLFSDHLAMRNSAEKFYPKEYQRKLFWLILNHESGINSQQGTHMDVAPTILDVMGVKHNADFLAGNSLLKSVDTSVNINTHERIQAIKYVNSNFFSKGNYSLCTEEYLVTAQSELKLGNQNIILSFEGEALNTDRFKHDIAIIAFIDDTGKIKKSSIINLANLVNILHANQRETFLLISPNRELPYWLNNAVEPDDKSILVLFGKLYGTITNLGSFANFQQINIKNSNCQELIKTVDQPASKCTIDSKYIASYSNGVITIPRVISLDGTFKGILKQQSPEQFIVESYSHSNLPININEMDHCYASYADSILAVPFVLDDGTTHYLKMKLISDKPAIFKINDAIFKDNS